MQSLRVVAPVMPFLAEHLWQALVADRRRTDAPASVFLAGWPARREQPGRRRAARGDRRGARTSSSSAARARARRSLKLRQPLRRLYVRGAPRARGHADEIAEELRVKEVGFDGGPSPRSASAAEPAPARARGSAAGCPRCAPRSSRRLRAARGRPPARGRRGARARRGDPRRARRARGLGDRRGRRHQRRVRHELDDELRRRAACSTSSTGSTDAQGAGLELTDRIVVTLPHATRTCWRTDWIARRGARGAARARRAARGADDRQGDPAIEACGVPDLHGCRRTPSTSRRGDRPPE